MCKNNKPKQASLIFDKYTPQNDMVAIMMLQVEGAVGPLVQWLHSAPPRGLEEKHQVHQVHEICFVSNRAENSFVSFVIFGEVGLVISKD